MHFSTLIPTLQLAVGPVILISGIGLLLLGMSNRYGRTIDRTREIARDCRDLPTSDRERATAQLRILMSRVRLLRTAIALAWVRVLLAAVLLIVLFVGTDDPRRSRSDTVASVYNAAECHPLVNA